MAPVTRTDPLPAFCFKVEITIGGQQRGQCYFQSVSGLTYENDVEDFREGGVNHTTRRLVGSVKWPNLILKNGFTNGGSSAYSLLTWREEWLYDIATRKVERASGKIIQLSHKLEKICEWQFERGWPCKWVGPEYDASKSELAIETLEIAHEGLKFSR
jgi:phage tail-like protein